MMPIRLCVLGTGLASLLAGPATAEPVGLLDCKPALSHYCRNIHVGCAGRTNHRGAPFQLHFGDVTATAHFANGSAATLDVNPQRTGWLLSEATTGDWIRLWPGGAFAHRTYATGTPMMIRGTCSERDQVPDATR